MEYFRIYFILCFLIYILHTCDAQTDQSKSITTLISEATLSEDGKLNFTQLVTKYGHTVKQYNITTADGYIIKIFNIVGNKKRPVLLLHGLLDSSDTYVLRGNTSLGITLANEGYDVWVGNNRGNLYGRQHVTLDPDNGDEFWNFSFHEIGYYDLPAMIDFVCEKTGVKKISTVGHSQGTTAHFVLLSTRPEYNKKIKIFIALAPIAYINTVGVLVASLFKASPVIIPALKLAHINEIFQDYQAASNLAKFICSKGIISYLLCGEGAIFPIAGFDTKELELDYLTKVAIGHFPRAISRKCLQHYAQVYSRRSFAQFDYGLQNIAKYGQLQPPVYNLPLLTTNVAMFAGGQDLLGVVSEVERLRDALSNIVHFQVIDSWGHLAFVAGRNMTKFLFPKLLSLLKKYN